MTKTRPKPKKGTGPEFRSAAGFSDVHDPNPSLLSVILTSAIRAMPYARFGGANIICEVALFRRVYRVVTIINLASRFDTQMSFTMEGSQFVLFRSGAGITIDVRIRGDSN